MSKNFVGTVGGRRELYQKNKDYGRKRFLFWWVKKKEPEQPGVSAMFAHIQGDTKDSKRGIGHMIQPDKPWPRNNEPMEIGIKHEASPMEDEYDSKSAKKIFKEL